MDGSSKLCDYDLSIFSMETSRPVVTSLWLNLVFIYTLSLHRHPIYPSPSLPYTHDAGKTGLCTQLGNQRISDFPPKWKPRLYSCPRTLMCALRVPHVGLTHCLILFRNTFKYVPSVLKDASSELCLETTQCFQSVACTRVSSFLFGNRQLDFNSWIFILCALEKKSN